MYVEIEDEEKRSCSKEETEIADGRSSQMDPPQPIIVNYSKTRKRSLYKAGQCNVRKKHAPKYEWLLHMQDIFTSLVESRWRWTLLVFSLSFLITWFLFGVLWWIVAHEHGDLIGYDMYDSNREPCVTMMNDFVSCFLFSLETQYSTGYGSRSPTTECPEAIILLIIQSIFGVLIQSTMAGIVFAKLSRPKARSQHIIFSKKAVICLRDGYMSLLFRVGDFRKSHIVGATVRAWMLQHRITPEGEVLPHYQHSMQLNVDSGGSDAFLIWPSTILHKIDHSSPLYNISAMDLLGTNFQIVVVLNGTVEATGQTTEARTSYLASQILWGHRFKQLIKYYRKRRYDFAVDYSRFDETFKVDTPLCSARELNQWNIPRSTITPEPSLPVTSKAEMFDDSAYKTL
ncbi:LOW QUALITY PROTEIN: ATP-sensitive inward rectifier potassium channel 12-like [Homalodisca vitripennis]|nr:LOW QUALITY PROTEIN: ATP-sensitive inward rectifier potassium channel 12-like [Homalodisca vitripennis]KAG8296901.1 Inward rectifier potassium channel [Homalodisca vitripennis]